MALVSQFAWQHNSKAYGEVLRRRIGGFGSRNHNANRGSDLVPVANYRGPRALGTGDLEAWAPTRSTSASHSLAQYEQGNYAANQVHSNSAGGPFL